MRLSIEVVSTTFDVEVEHTRASMGHAGGNDTHIHAVDVVAETCIQGYIARWSIQCGDNLTKGK